MAMPPQPANHGTGQGILGVLPASSLTQTAPQASPSQALAYADPTPHVPPQALQQQATQQNGAIKPATPAVARTGWIIQVGALESESEAKQRHRPRPQQGPRPARQGRSFHRAGRRQGQQDAVPRPLRRPRARPGRSGLPDAEARRHFLHYRSQLIRHLVRQKPAPQAPALLFSRPQSQNAVHTAATNRAPRKLLVKNLRLSFAE